jgi:hypothetical protein
MNKQLEELLKAWDAYVQARKGIEADRCLAFYQSLLEDHCQHSRVPKERLHLGLQRQYWRWVQAQRRFPTVPPKA